MKIKTFTFHPSARLRMAILEPTLIRHGHSIVNSLSEADLCILDVMHVHDVPADVMDSVCNFGGKIALSSLGDWNLFRLTTNDVSIPDELIEKASAFLKVQWSCDDSIYDSRITNKRITVQPFLIGGIPAPTSTYMKKPVISFYGLPTGHLDVEKNTRILACRTLKNHPAFRGGITGQEPGAIRNGISDIVISSRPRPIYLNNLNTSLISLCLPGNSPLSYRHFESLGVGSCVMSCDLNNCKWLNRMTPGIDYYEVKSDLSDLLVVCDLALSDIARTREIAMNGYALYQDYYRLQPDNSMTDNMWNDILLQFHRCGIEL